MWIFWLFLLPMLWVALWRSSSLCELKWNRRFVPGADLCAPATRECSVCWTKPEVVWIKTFKMQILWMCILFSAPNISLYKSLLLCSTAFRCRYSLLDLFFCLICLFTVEGGMNTVGSWILWAYLWGFTYASLSFLPEMLVLSDFKWEWVKVAKTWWLYPRSYRGRRDILLPMVGAVLWVKAVFLTHVVVQGLCNCRGRTT